VIGKPLALTAAELDQAAEVTPFDVLMAKALWQQHAEARFVGLLDGTITPDDFVGAT